MLEVDPIARQVLQNCAISDSRHAGLYSVCGLALRLRDLYKWEKGLEPWVEEDSSLVLEWIGEKEEEWERLAQKDFADIAILDNRYDPFQAMEINALLVSCGLLYGAGYVHSLKPSFFLALVKEKREINGCPVYIVGQELARDLLTVPALSQGGSIIIRYESAKLFLWNQLFFTKKSGREALSFALENYGLKAQGPLALKGSLEKICADELETYIHHELGEIYDDVFDRGVWREMIATFPHTPVELLARTVKDLLADTNEQGKLQYIARERKTASLALHVAFLDGIRKALFPELPAAFKEFMKTGDWRSIEAAIAAGHNKARRCAEAICDIYREGKHRNDMKWAEREMERGLLEPLGIGRSMKEG